MIAFTLPEINATATAVHELRDQYVANVAKAALRKDVHEELVAKAIVTILDGVLGKINQERQTLRYLEGEKERVRIWQLAANVS